MVHADETGWREDGHNGYVWTFSTPTERYFLRRGRGKAVVDEVLGDQFAGVLVSDFYAAYHHYDGPKQRCWAHLLRDIHDLRALYPMMTGMMTGWPNGLTPSTNSTVRRPPSPILQSSNGQSSNGQSSNGQSRAATARAAEQQRPEQQRPEQQRPEQQRPEQQRPEQQRPEQQRRTAQLALEQRLLALCRTYQDDPSAPPTRLCRRMENHIKELFLFVAEPEVPPDNNAAERSLRPVVISRKISGGTRSAAGTDTKMTLASIFGTWRVQGFNPLTACRQLLTSPQA